MQLPTEPDSRLASHPVRRGPLCWGCLHPHYQGRRGGEWGPQPLEQPCLPYSTRDMGHSCGTPLPISRSTASQDPRAWIQGGPDGSFPPPLPAQALPACCCPRSIPRLLPWLGTCSLPHTHSCLPVQKCSDTHVPSMRRATDTCLRRQGCRDPKIDGQIETVT